MDEGTLDRQREAVGDAEQELTEAVAAWLREQERQGLDLPEGFPERAALAIAERARGALDRLAFRCVTAGVDSAADERQASARDTPEPPAPR